MTEKAKAPPKQRRRKPWVLALWVILIGGIVALLQVDLVRQNLEIFWIGVTGQGWKLHGQVHTVTVHSQVLRQSRHLLIYTPPGYDANDARTHYPTLYLLHGCPDPGDGWNRYGRAAEEVDRLCVQEGFPPLIVVCPDGNGLGSFGDSEYIDAVNPKLQTAPASRVATYLTDEIIPYIDKNYRTIDTADGRLIGGISTGGYGAVNLGLHRPDLFSTLFAFSAYFRADDSGWARPVWGKSPTAVQLREQSPLDYLTPGQTRWKHTFVVLGDGKGDRNIYRSETANFARKLQACGIGYENHELPGRHSWDLWRGLLRNGLRSVRDRIPRPQ